MQSLSQVGAVEGGGQNGHFAQLWCPRHWNQCWVECRHLSVALSTCHVLRSPWASPPLLLLSVLPLGSRKAVAL